jgi:hypothetical protein
VNSIYAFIEARLEEDMCAASEASRKPHHGEFPADGVNWFWSTEQDTDALLDEKEEFIGGDEDIRVSLRSREEWPCASAKYGGHATLPQFAIRAEEVPYAVGVFVTRFDPARILTDVALKRRILEEHREVDGRCRVCASRFKGEWKRFIAPCWTVRDLASAYHKHPDYQEGWSTT